MSDRTRTRRRMNPWLKLAVIMAAIALAICAARWFGVRMGTQ
jgi:hypothetical protein